MSLASRLRSFAALAMPGFGNLPSKAPTPTARELRDMIAYVDPSKLIQMKMFVPYNPSILVTRKGLTVFDSMKLDEQVKSALQFKKDSVLGAGWEITSPADQPADWEVTQLVRDEFTRIEGGFHRALLKMMTALDYGYSVTEKVYKPRADGKLGIARLISCKPHYFDFQIDEHGQLISVLQQNVPGATVAPYPPDKFIIYSYQEEFENVYGRADLEAAYRAWWVKDNAYKWWAISLERYGMPPLFLLYNINAYKREQVEELKKVVKGIQNATLGTLPRNAPDDLELWHPQLGAAAKEVFVAALSRFDQDIARALLVPGMIGMTNDEQQGGSLARSETQFNSFLTVVEQLKLDVATLVNDQLVRQLCDLNFPKLDAYPLFKFLAPKDEKLNEMLTMWSALVAGKIVNRIEDDEKHIRKAVGFPENENPTIEELPQDTLAKAKADATLNPPARPAPKGGKAFDLEEDALGGWRLPDEVTLESLAESLDEDELTDEARAYAAAEDCQWVTIRGRHVCLRKPQRADERVRRAQLSHKPASYAKQREAEKQELRITQLLGGERTGDNEAMDVTLKVGRRLHGVEVKTFTDNTNDKITMHPEALARKVKWARKEGAQLHTVLIDARQSFDGGNNARYYSGHEMYYRSDVGSYRLNGMIKVRNEAHLRALIAGKERS